MTATVAAPTKPEGSRTLKPAYKPRKQFLPAHNRSQRYGVVIAHRRCGKTVFFVNELIERGAWCKKPSPQYAYIAPQLKQAKRIAWDYLKKFSAHICKKVNESELYVELLNGAKIYILGADDPDSARGFYFDGVVLDEAAQIKPSFVTEVIRPTLLDRKGWLLIGGTPKGKGNILYSYFCKAQQDRKKWFLLTLKASETGIIGKAELEEIQADMDEAEYQQEFECSFDAALKGAYYGKQIRQLDLGKRFTTVPYTEGIPVSLAMDIGRNDACAIWFWQVVKGRVNVIKYWEESGYDAEQVVDALDLMGYDYDTWWIPHDAFHHTFASKKSTYDTFRDYGVHVRRVPNPDKGNKVSHGIDAARKVMRTYPIYMDAQECSRGIECLKNYSREWSQKEGQFKDNPSHNKYSHGADAWRYLCLSLDPNEVKASLEKHMRSVASQSVNPKGISINKRQTFQQALEEHDRAVLREQMAGRGRV